MKRFKKDGTPTKQFLAFMKAKYREYSRSTATSLYDVYAKPSDAKLRSLAEIKERVDRTVFIICHNTDNFTVAYIIYDESLDTNLFVVETKNNIYAISGEYI